MSRKSCNGSLIELVNAKKRLVPVLKINRPPSLYTVDPLHGEATGEIAHILVSEFGPSLDR